MDSIVPDHFHQINLWPHFTHLGQLLNPYEQFLEYHGSRTDKITVGWPRPDTAVETDTSGDTPV